MIKLGQYRSQIIHNFTCDKKVQIGDTITSGDFDLKCVDKNKYVLITDDVEAYLPSECLTALWEVNKSPFGEEFYKEGWN